MNTFTVHLFQIEQTFNELCTSLNKSMCFCLVLVPYFALNLSAFPTFAQLNGKENKLIILDRRNIFKWYRRHNTFRMFFQTKVVKNDGNGETKNKLRS